MTAVFKCRKHFTITVFSPDGRNSKPITFGGWQPMPKAGFRGLKTKADGTQYIDDIIAAGGARPPRPVNLDSVGRQIKDPSVVPLWGKIKGIPATDGQPFRTFEQADLNAIRLLLMLTAVAPSSPRHASASSPGPGDIRRPPRRMTSSRARDDGAAPSLAGVADGHLRQPFRGRPGILSPMPDMDARHWANAEALYQSAAAALYGGLMATAIFECSILSQAGCLHRPQPSWELRDPTPTPPDDVARQIAADLAWLKSNVLPRIRAGKFHGTATILLSSDDHHSVKLSVSIRETVRRP